MCFREIQDKSFIILSILSFNAVTGKKSDSSEASGKFILFAKLRLEKFPWKRKRLSLRHGRDYIEKLFFVVKRFSQNNLLHFIIMLIVHEVRLPLSMPTTS